MSRLWPTAGEAALLHFAQGSAGFGRRMLAAGALFGAGLVLWCWLPPVFSVLGLVVVLAGHVPLWVRSQTTAPGGATPRHEEIWVPVEEGWMDRVVALERRGERWDTTPFDVSNVPGCLILVAALAGIALVAVAVRAAFGFEAGLRLWVGAAALLVPLWINGMRTTWNPSELRKKGKALTSALAAFRAHGGEDAGEDAGDFDPVPMLALREGRRGKYPVDAKLMLRPSEEDGSGFLGVQVQVAMNNVQGTDYAYLYAVVLGKRGFRLPDAAELGGAQVSGQRKLVFETGEDKEVRFLVIRQHADNRGGWSTDDAAIRRIVDTALDAGRRAWRANRPGSPA